MNGPSVSYRCRSEPHSPLEVIRTIASFGSWIVGVGDLLHADVALCRAR